MKNEENKREKRREKTWIIFQVLLPLVLGLLAIVVLLLAGIGFAYIISINTDVPFFIGMMIWMIISIVFILFAIIYTRRR